MAKVSQNRWFSIQLFNRAALIRLAILSIILVILFSWAWFAKIQMPGQSFRGQLSPLTRKEVALRDALKRDVEKLASEIGQRNYDYYNGLTAAADFLKASLAQAGYQVQQQDYAIDKQMYYNSNTAAFRYLHYHTMDDTPDKVNYEYLARVVAGLEQAIAELSGLSQPEPSTCEPSKIHSKTAGTEEDINCSNS
jgi:hypothetical protein